jgi:hypothetical protein
MQRRQVSNNRAAPRKQRWKVAASAKKTQERAKIEASESAMVPADINIVDEQYLEEEEELDQTTNNC